MRISDWSSDVCSSDLAKHGSVKKVVLAYSGGLDTSVILKWLQETYGCEVVTFTADLGQGEELEPARAKAEMFGVKQRSEERRVGKEGVSTGRSRWGPYH